MTTKNKIPKELKEIVSKAIEQEKVRKQRPRKPMKPINKVWPWVNRMKHELYVELSEVTGRKIGVIKQFFSNRGFSILDEEDRKYYTRQSKLIKQRK